MRITHFISGDLWAGAEVMACKLLKSLHQMPGLGVSAFILNGGRLAEELSRAGVDVQVVEENHYSFLQLLWYARAFVKSRSPHIIHSHRFKENLLAFLVADCGLNAHLVATQHGMAEPRSERLPFSKKLISTLHKTILANRFGNVVGVSENIQTHLIEACNHNPSKTSLIHNGISLPKEPLFCASKDTLLIGSAGRLFPVKDYPLMVNIAHKICQTDGNIRVELSGDGPEFQNLKRLIREKGLGEDFILRGEINDLHEIYKDMDIYLNTSLHEGIPMSILEAMSYGIPVIAPQVGGIPEIIEDGVEGFLIDSRDPAAFAEKCLLLGKNFSLRRRMGAAARDKVRRQFSVQKMTDEYLKVYQGLVFGAQELKAQMRVSGR